MAEGRADTPGLIDPAIQWGVDEASPSGLAYFGGSLWVACLRGERLFRIPVGADGALGDPAPLFVGRYGRLRHSHGRTGRHPVVHDQQPRRSWEPARRRRPYRSVPALTRTVQRTKRDECHCERIRVFAADVTARSAGVSVPLGTQRTNLDFGACGVVALSRQKAWRCGEFPCTPTELQR
jgi:hypothetical protein